MMPATIDDIPLAHPCEPPRYDEAARLLERAAQGSSDPQVQYLLALAYKRQGKSAEARTTLRKISRPDAAVFLQLGLLSLGDNLFDQAEQELARARQLDPASFAICYNLLMTRLTLGQFETAVELLAAAVALAETPEQQRFIRLLQALLETVPRNGRVGAGDLPPLPVDSPLHDITAAEEQRLLKIVRSLGQIDTIYSLLQTLALARNGSRAAQEAFHDASLVRGRELMARARWTEAEVLLDGLSRERSASRGHQLAAFTLLGGCCYLTHDFERAGRYFTHAVKLRSDDARLSQNLALAHEMQGNLTHADNPWNRFFDLLESTTLASPEDVPRYQESLLFESLSRLANLYAEKEKWPQVLNYLQRAHRLRPQEDSVLERLFHTYVAAKRNDNARRILDKLRIVRPDDPRIELYELDLVEVKRLDDIEKLLTDVDRIRRRYPDDARVEERAVNMVGNVIPLMENLCNQFTEQLNKVMDQVRGRPRYQIDWGALRSLLRDLGREYQKLRRITGKCLPLVSREEHKRAVRELAEHIDEKIELCRSMQH